MRGLQAVLTAFAMGLAASFANADIDQPSVIPPDIDATAAGSLARDRDVLMGRLNDVLVAIQIHNVRCGKVASNDGAAVSACQTSQSRIKAMLADYDAARETFDAALHAAPRRAADPFNRYTPHVRIQELTTKIERDLQAIRNLGFDRRESDFVAWDILAATAKGDFESQVVDVVTDVAVDKVRGKLLASFKAFDPAKANTLVTWIRAQAFKPEPKELIAKLEKLGRSANKDMLAADAELIVQEIERWQAGLESSDDPIAAAAVVATILESAVDDPRLKILVTEIKLTTASLYNNATRRVALNEVERLTDLTEKQLGALHALQRQLVRDIKERKKLLTTPQ